MMSHVPSMAAAEASVVRWELSANGRAAIAAVQSQLAGPGAHLADSAGGATSPVSNTFSIYDVHSNYIGGSIGLQSFVDGLYRNVFHREPDPTGEAFWTGALESGTYTPYTVVSFFLQSPEAVKAGGSGAPLQPSHPPANIYTGFLGGPVGVTAFVDGLYEDVLDRAPDPAGEAYWVGQIENHDLLPAKITFAFLAASG